MIKGITIIKLVTIFVLLSINFESLKKTKTNKTNRIISWVINKRAGMKSCANYPWSLIIILQAHQTPIISIMSISGTKIIKTSVNFGIFINLNLHKILYWYSFESL